VFILADFHIGYSPEHEGGPSVETLAISSVSVAICYVQYRSAERDNKPGRKISCLVAWGDFLLQGSFTKINKCSANENTCYPIKLVV